MGDQSAGWNYNWTPLMWPVLGSSTFLACLSAYGWRRQSVPGALPHFALLTLCGTIWGLGATLELAAADVTARIFWIKFQAVWHLPTVVASLWFALEYANLGEWQKRGVNGPRGTLRGFYRVNPQRVVLLLGLTAARQKAYYWFPRSLGKGIPV